MLDRQGASPLKILLSIAAVLVAVVFITMGQLYFGLGVLVLAVIFGAAALFNRAKTPTD